MKKLLTLLLILTFSVNPAFTNNKYKLKVTNYYSMATDLETLVTKWDGSNINFKVVEVEDEDKSVYPVGTEFIGRVTEKKEARRFNRDECLMIHVSQVKLPSGLTRAEDLKFNLHARGIINSERMATTVIGATALTLGTIFDATVVGLPISRGGYGIWYSAQGIRNREPDSSRFKAGIIGFAKGVVFPIPQLIGRGRNLGKLHVGSRISIDEESHGKSIDAYLRA
jgi:hypothetical protein